MRQLTAANRTVPAVAQIDLFDVRSRQSAGVSWSARGWGCVAVLGVWRVGSRGQRKQLWLGACRVKDQLQPKGSPRRMYNARVRVMEWFRFNSYGSADSRTAHPGPYDVYQVCTCVLLYCKQHPFHPLAQRATSTFTFLPSVDEEVVCVVFYKIMKYYGPILLRAVIFFNLICFFF